MASLPVPRRADLPPRQTEPPPALLPSSRGELQFSANREPPTTFLHPPLPFPYLAVPLTQLTEPPLAGAGSRSGRPSLAAGEPLAGTTTDPAKHPNRAPLAPRSPPCPSPANPGGELAGFCPPAPASRPRDYIAKRRFFPRASLQKVNSNSKTLWLILVNCVENHRKLIKM
jgi:hypothetical protein